MPGQKALPTLAVGVVHWLAPLLDVLCNPRAVPGPLPLVLLLQPAAAPMQPLDICAYAQPLQSGEYW